MHEDPHVTLVLETSDSPGDLQIISVRGHDSLNAPFCFEIDAISSDPRLEQTDMLQAGACLVLAEPGQPAHRIHGQIFGFSRRYRGNSLSLYRLTLMPGLQRLALRTGRRVFNGLDVKQIITALLSDHGMGDDAYRFEHLIGVYLPRRHCVQYDESDLHLLQRLCAEEGIVFRFEHREDRHILVFSDDPAGFPECPQPARVEDLAEHLSMRTCYSSHFGANYVPQPPTRLLDWADNDLLPAETANEMPPDPGRQRSERQLQRLRCERRRVIGHSRLPWLNTGKVIRVTDHDEASLNDQWLLKEVHHVGKQWSALRHCPPVERADLLQRLDSQDRPTPADSGDTEGYSNTFEVTPWAMPFRPSLLPRQPRAGVTEQVTQTCAKPDSQGRLSFRYDWQTSGDDCSAPMVGSLPHTGIGARLNVVFFEGDPDQPLIRGVVDEGHACPGTSSTPTVADVRPDPEQTQIHLLPDQRLIFDATQQLVLRSALGTMKIGPDGIRLSPPAKAHPLPIRSGNRPTMTASAREPMPKDLQLRHPDVPGRVLPHCVWYIVRMATPDMKKLARLAADDILFEGETDADGWLGLGRDNLARLLQLHRDLPDQLCVAHPGHCRPLHDCFWPAPVSPQETSNTDAEVYP